MPNSKNSPDVEPVVKTLPAAVLILILLAIFLTFVGAASIIFFPRHTPAELEQEKNNLIAAEIVQFTEVSAAAVTYFEKRGIPATEIDFSPEGTGDKALFSSAGGKISYRPVPIQDHSNPEWEFKKPFVDGSGWYITGAGHDGAGGGDIFIALQNIPAPVCLAINARLGYGTDIIFSQQTAIDLSLPGPPDRATPESSLSAARGKPAACIENGAGSKNYIFYRVLKAF